MRLKPAIAIMLCITGLSSFASADGFFSNLVGELKTQIDKASNQVDQVNDLAGRADGQIDQTATELGQAEKQARQAIEDARNFSLIPGTGSPNSMDVIGLRLGMTAQEVKMVLQRHDVTMQIQEQYSQLPRVPNSRYLHRISAISATREQVVIEFAPPPRESIVVRLTRTTQYAQGARPTLTKTQQALKQKYGTPTLENNRRRMHVSLWLHDGRGNKITSPSAVQAQQCTQASRVSIDHLMISQQQDKVLAECGASLDIQLGTIGSKNNGLVGSLVATLSNPAEMVRTTQQTRAYINKNIGVQVGNNIRAPKL